jgi:hypothetical protein
MTDIVERLRSYASDDHERLCQGREYSCTCGYDEKRDPLLAEAAAKIERLNRELDDVWDALAIQREDNGSFGDAFKRMTAEIERLRAALLKIKRGSVWNCDIEAFIDATLAQEKPHDR